MAEYEDMLEDLEKEVEETEKEFEKGKPGADQDKQKKAEELMQEIRGQIEFLEEQLDRTQ